MWLKSRAGLAFSRVVMTQLKSEQLLQITSGFWSCVWQFSPSWLLSIVYFLTLCAQWVAWEATHFLSQSPACQKQYFSAVMASLVPQCGIAQVPFDLGRWGLCFPAWVPAVFTSKMCEAETGVLHRQTHRLSWAGRDASRSTKSSS